MKFYLFILSAPFAFISCADTGSGLFDPANSVPPAKKVTKTKSEKQQKVDSGYIHTPSMPNNSATEHVVVNNGRDDYKKYAVKHSPYGSLKDAAAPPTKEELAAEPDPINMPEKNIITPPTGG